MAAHILLSPVGQKTETRFNCLLTENRKSTEMMVEARCYQNDSWSARRVIGATAKPLYPIDGKAAGLDRRTPKTSLFEGGGPPAGGGRSKQAVEGVFSRRKAYSFPKLKYMRQNAEPCACLRRILLNFIFNSARSVNVPAFFRREHPPRTQEI